MDILFYSNKCKYCQKLLPFLVKNQISDKINFICIDKREIDPRTGQTAIVLENGTRYPLPPNIHRVPSLVLVQQKYRAVTGDEIYQHLQPLAKSDLVATNGEPVGFMFSGTANNNVVSDTFTPYGFSSGDLAANGQGIQQMHNYSSAYGDMKPIETPPEQYKPDKIGSDMTIDSLQQQRNMDLQTHMPPMAAQLNNILSSQHMPPPPGYSTMAVLPPSKSRDNRAMNGGGMNGGGMNGYSYSPINAAPKYTAEDAREILFGKGSGWSGKEDSTTTNTQGQTALPAPYLY